MSKFTNSPLATVVVKTNKHSGARKYPITKVIIHHAVAVWTAQRLGEFFRDGNRQASSQYGIGNDGSIGLYVDEANRAWTTGSPTNPMGAEMDHRGVTIEVCNSQTSHPYPVSNAALSSLIDLVTDICRRNGIKECTFTGDSRGVLQMHEWYAPTNCPGPYLKSKFPYIVQEVNKRLNPPVAPKPAPGALYRVQVGAFGRAANAVAMEKKLKAAGYSTYMVESGGLIKVQAGAFAKKANADALAAKLRKAGFDTFITTQQGKPYTPPVAKPAPPKPTIKVGSRVRVARGAKDYNGGGLLDFVYQTVYTVMELNGNRAVIGTGGQVTAAIHVNNLYLA